MTKATKATKAPVLRTRNMWSNFWAKAPKTIGKQVVLRNRDAAPAVLDAFRMSNALFLEPDGKDPKGNFAYHFDKVKRVITAYTKEMWPAALHDPVVRCGVPSDFTHEFGYTPDSANHVMVFVGDKSAQSKGGADSFAHHGAFKMLLKADGVRGFEILHIGACPKTKRRTEQSTEAGRTARALDKARREGTLPRPLSRRIGAALGCVEPPPATPSLTGAIKEDVDEQELLGGAGVGNLCLGEMPPPLPSRCLTQAICADLPMPPPPQRANCEPIYDTETFPASAVRPQRQRQRQVTWAPALAEVKEEAPLPPLAPPLLRRSTRFGLREPLLA